MQRAEPLPYDPVTSPTPEPRLTARAIQVGALVANGLSNKQIGELLDIKTPTVKDHLAQLFRHFGVRRRDQLAVMWVTSGRPRGLIPKPRVRKSRPKAP